MSDITNSNKSCICEKKKEPSKYSKYPSHSALLETSGCMVLLIGCFFCQSPIVNISTISALKSPKQQKENIIQNECVSFGYFFILFSVLVFLSFVVIVVIRPFRYVVTAHFVHGSFFFHHSYITFVSRIFTPFRKDCADNAGNLYICLGPANYSILTLEPLPLVFSIENNCDWDFQSCHSNRKIYK